MLEDKEFYDFVTSKIAPGRVGQGQACIHSAGKLYIDYFLNFPFIFPILHLIS